MRNSFILHKEYTFFNGSYQLVLGYTIPANDSVRLLSQFIERMFLGDLYRTYHLIRYLKKNTEETGHKWSERMISLLCRMNQERKTQIEQCARAFPPEAVSAFEKDYENMIFQGREENKKTKYLYAQKDEKALLNRMEKNRQKMAGGFRKASGHEMYCSILRIIETLKRRNMGMLEQKRSLFMGTPAIF